MEGRIGLLPERFDIHGVHVATYKSHKQVHIYILWGSSIYGVATRNSQDRVESETVTLRSKDPNNRVLGPKHHSYYSIWALKPCYSGPWTLRVSASLAFNPFWVSGSGFLDLGNCLRFVFFCF